jgi:hypothetical protein
MKIQSICSSAGDYGCLAFIYLWCAGIPEINIITEFDKLVGIGALDTDCTVLDAGKLLRYFGVNAKVTKSFTAPENSSKYAARWTNAGHFHYVGMIDGKIAENTLDYSHCVSEGKIDTDNPDNPPYRIVEVQ